VALEATQTSTLETETLLQDLITFNHTPYDTLSFYQSRSFWSLWGSA
jgi:hypothetical protein